MDQKLLKMKGLAIDMWKQKPKRLAGGGGGGAEFISLKGEASSEPPTPPGLILLWAFPFDVGVV